MIQNHAYLHTVVIITIIVIVIHNVGWYYNTLLGVTISGCCIRLERCAIPLCLLCVCVVVSGYACCEVSSVSVLPSVSCRFQPVAGLSSPV